MGLREDLGPGPTALDTALFIYYIEENESFLPLVAPIFEDVAGGRREVVTSTLLHPSVRTPDALQLASALSAGCATFVTNDRDLPALPGLRILKLRSYL